ncbi:hypothetical protein O9993_15710 [Vibrio lentus]|nr:hypothetical protein [Vibrio lentus]
MIVETIIGEHDAKLRPIRDTGLPKRTQATSTPPIVPRSNHNGKLCDADSSTDEIRQSVDEFETDIKVFAKELSKKAIKSKSLMD